MKKVRFAADGRVRSGIWDGTRIIEGTGRSFDPNSVVWLPPVEPTKVIGLALNYADHAEELSLPKPPVPALFFQAPNTFVGHKSNILFPKGGVEYMHYEAELAVVINQQCRRVPESRAMDYILGYTVANDCTIRDFVTNLFRPPVKPKGFDTFLPIGPWLVIDEIDDPNNLAVTTEVNGEIRQIGNTSDLMFKIPEIIAYISEFATLEPGDLILTGTPKGVSHIHPGDKIVCTVEKVGSLENYLIREEEVLI